MTDFNAHGAPDAQGDVEPYAKFMVDTVRSNKDAKEPDMLLKVRLPEPPVTPLLEGSRGASLPALEI